MRKLRHLGRLARQLWHFARETRAYWLVPLLVVLGLLALAIAGGQVATPFVYTLF